MTGEEAVRGGAAVGAVVLAAGASTRMGATKQLLRLGERTVLERTLGNVRGADVAETVVVLGAAAAAIEREIDFASMGAVRVVVNAEYESGMASSLRVGLAALGPAVDGALIVLGDQPLVRGETLGRIIECYRVTGDRLRVTADRSQSVEIVIPMYGERRGNPVLLDRGVFEEAMALEGDVGCRAIFGRHAAGIVTVDVDDPGILVDIDSKEDYARVRGEG
jgi:molybdenum cofactor cytidylyltransferase